ncbi:hypothetical protein E4U53_007667 [Claviceps sorghi]|nr:hypothetical protein E4U53_007667 [Claviceps sorghi]
MRLRSIIAFAFGALALASEVVPSGEKLSAVGLAEPHHAEDALEVNTNTLSKRESVSRSIKGFPVPPGAANPVTVTLLGLSVTFAYGKKTLIAGSRRWHEYYLKTVTVKNIKNIPIQIAVGSYTRAAKICAAYLTPQEMKWSDNVPSHTTQIDMKIVEYHPETGL